MAGKKLPQCKENVTCAIMNTTQTSAISNEDGGYVAQNPVRQRKGKCRDLVTMPQKLSSIIFAVQIGILALIQEKQARDILFVTALLTMNLTSQCIVFRNTSFQMTHLTKNINSQSIFTQCQNK